MTARVESSSQDMWRHEGAGRQIRFRGLTTIVHVVSGATGGAATDSARPPNSTGTPPGSAALLEHILEPFNLGAPPHRHAREDEISHVLAGRLAVWQAGELHVAGPGETIVKPRNVFHTFWNPGDEPVRFLEVIAPGTGFERYFEEIAPLIPAAGAPDIPGLMAVAARYGLELDMAPVPELLASHGLRM
ncbi:MAG: cupin domain-containing protein [Trueperaceae bacterium]